MNDHIAEPGPRSPGPRPDLAPSHGTLLAAEDDRTGGSPSGGPGPDGTRGCLFALSQPPLMIFLGIIGFLLLMAAVHDLYAG